MDFLLSSYPEKVEGGSCVDVGYQRGRNTGGYYTDTTPWRSFQRSRLASLGSSHIKEEIAVLAAPPRVPNDLPLEKTVQMIPEGWLNDRLMDLGLAYEPVQCSHEGSSSLCPLFQGLLAEIHQAGVIRWNVPRDHRGPHIPNRPNVRR